MLSKRSLAIFFIIFAVIAGSMFIWSKMSPPKESPPIINQSDWQEFSYPDLGITLKAPAYFQSSENGEYSRTISKKSEEQVQGNSSFIYFSVVPRGMENTEGLIYNYNSADFNTLVAMQDGETKVLGGSDDENQNRYFTYTKMENVMLGGYGTKSYINTKPWEFPSGTTEYRFITEFGNAKYIFGGYLGLNVNAPDYISRDEFNKILETVKFNPEAVNPVNPASATLDWNNFTDEVDRISFKYPKNWQVRTDSQNFPEGDLFSAGITGQTQRTQTELYDGATFAVMKPVFSEKDVLPWMKDKYIGANPNPEVNNETQFSEETIAQRTYQKAIDCGLGCFTYYHFKEYDKIYGFVFYAEGPDKEVYTQDFQKILESVVFIPFPES